MKFNEVTWYSKLAAIIFFIGVLPMLTFYIGTKYQEVISQQVWQDTSIQTTIPTSTKNQNALVDALARTDFYKASYPIYIPDNGRYGSIHNITFKGEGRGQKVAIEKMEGGELDVVEYFWLNSIKYGEEDNTAKVYILGETENADDVDIRIFNVTKVDGQLLVKAEPAL